MTSLIDQQLGPYKIIRRIAEGGMGTVYQAVDTQTGRTAALKVLPERVARDDALVASILERARFAIGLEHPHLVATYDAGETEGVAWFASQWVEGQSLRHTLTEQGRLSLVSAYWFVEQVAGVLDYLHTQGVVHRNLKLSAIVADPAGQVLLGPMPETMGVRGIEEPPSKSRIPVGTPAYMSPEQAQGQALDGRSDIYALGVILYEMLAGEPPFRGPSAVAVMAQHVLNEPPPLSQARPDLAPAVEQVVLKALAKDPADRYATASALAEALRSVIPKEVEGAVQQHAALSQRLVPLKQGFTGLARVDAGRELGLVAQLEQQLGEALQAIQAADFDSAIAALVAADNEMRSLEQRLAEQQALEVTIGELLAEISQQQEACFRLQERIRGAAGIDFADELQAIEEMLEETEAVISVRYAGTRELEDVLTQLRELDALQQAAESKIEAYEYVAARLPALREKMGPLSKALDRARGLQARVAAERQQVEEQRATLSRAERFFRAGRARRARSALEQVDEALPDKLLETVQSRVEETRRLSRKTVLDLSRLSATANIVSYNVVLTVQRQEREIAIQESIKVSRRNRRGLMSVIETLTESVNFRLETRRKSRGSGSRRAAAARAAFSSLLDLGYTMYRLFLPSGIQSHLKGTETSLMIRTNDLEVPWELMYDGDDFLCLQSPVGRMPMLRRFPRTNPYQRGDTLRFLFIVNPTGDLEASEDEAEQIAVRLEEIGADVELWKREEVSGVRLISALPRGEYDVIHYAGHAYFDPVHPDASGLILADEDLLIADEIERMLGGRPLVFLNACESGKEATKEGGEVSYTGSNNEGLAASFIMGGALGFIGALWPIFDDDSAQFAIHFYEQLLQGEMIGEAMRQARLKLRAAWPDDVTWASFILYGDPTLRIVP